MFAGFNSSKIFPDKTPCAMKVTRREAARRRALEKHLSDESAKLHWDTKGHDGFPFHTHEGGEAEAQILIGQVGTVDQVSDSLKSHGKVLIDGERYSAQANEPLRIGSKVQVIKVNVAAGVLKVEEVELATRRAEERNRESR